MKYRVVLRWTKFIDFGDIEAESTDEAVVIAQHRLKTDRSLVEEECKNEYEVEEVE